jgi:hypothetical protein
VNEKMPEGVAMSGPVVVIWKPVAGRPRVFGMFQSTNQAGKFGAENFPSDAGIGSWWVVHVEGVK